MLRSIAHKRQRQAYAACADSGTLHSYTVAPGFRKDVFCTVQQEFFARGVHLLQYRRLNHPCSETLCHERSAAKVHVLKVHRRGVLRRLSLFMSSIELGDARIETLIAVGKKSPHTRSAITLYFEAEGGPNAQINPLPALLYRRASTRVVV